MIGHIACTWIPELGSKIMLDAVSIAIGTGIHHNIHFWGVTIDELCVLVMMILTPALFTPSN